MGITKTRIRRMILWAAVIVGVVFFTLQGWVATILSPLATPLVQAGTWISQQVFWWDASRALTSDELEKMSVREDELVREIARLETYRRENEELRALLEFTQRVQAPTVAANILSKSLSHSTSKIVIDAGSQQGVQLGAAVVAGEGIFLGTVTELAGSSSTVTTLADPLQSVAVSLLNDHRTIGLATGTLGGLLRIDFIPADEAIATDELVVTSGLSDPIPSGLLVGIVNTVWQDIGDPFQTAIVEPMADVRRLSSVLVLLPPFSP